MSVLPDASRQAGLWVEKAEHDLANAEHTLLLKDDCPADTAALHAQQCAEKYLKSLLVLHGKSVPRTHDLVTTLRLVCGVASLDLTAEDVLVLNRYATEARYPGDWEEITREEAVSYHPRSGW